MCSAIDEASLIRKLVLKWHLNVPERVALTGGKVCGTFLCAAIEEVIHARGWYPAEWRPDGCFAGGLIERRPDGTCRIYWKSEVGVLRYELDAVQECGSVRDAARILAREFFRGDIDGIPIDWDA